MNDLPQNPMTPSQNRGASNGLGQVTRIDTPGLGHVGGGRPIANGSDDADLVALLRTIWRGKWLIILCTFLAACLSIAYLLFLAEPTFRATATVALESREAQVVDIESVVSGLSGDQASINTEVQVLRSRTLIGAVVDKMDLTSDSEFNASLRAPKKISVGQAIGFVRELVTGPQPPEVKTPDQQRNAVIDSVSEELSISNVRQSYVFQITASSKDAEKARDIANVVADLYLENQLEAKFEATERATTWLTGRVAELQIALEAAEQSVKDFSAEIDLVGVDVLEAQERQVKDLRERATDGEVAFESARQRLSALQSAETSAHFVELSKDPTLRRLLADGAGDSLAFERRREQVVTRAQVVADRARDQLAALQDSVAELQTQTSDQAQDLVQLRQLQREAEASRLIYEYFLSRLKETSVQQGIQQADARILSLAVAPLRAATPRKSMTLVIFSLLGMFFAAALVLFREMTQSTYRSGDILEEDTGYSVIGQIPVMAIKRREKIKDYIISNPASAAVEAIRNLRTTLLLQNLDNPPRVVMSTSSIASEGKTTQSVGLAINLASMGKRVLLIEGDIRRRVFDEYFNIPGTRGLVSVLVGNAEFDDVVHTDAKLNIDVLQGEASRVNAADLYSSNKFLSFLQNMRARYDFVVLDMPPVLPVPDARIVAKHVDAIMFTVKWDSTPKAQVRHGLRLFESINAPISGLVLSQVDPKGMKRYGYGDYGASSYYQEA